MEEKIKRRFVVFTSLKQTLQNVFKQNAAGEKRFVLWWYVLFYC